jgi:hypothetical protein
MSDEPQGEVIGALVGLLIDEGIAGGYVFGDEIPDDDAIVRAMPRAAVEISPTGGSGTASQSWLDTQRIDVRSFGASPEEARTVGLAVHQVLNRLLRRVVDGILIHSAVPGSGFLSGREIDTRWPYTWRSYNVLYDFRPAEARPEPESPGSGSGQSGS